MNTHAEKTRPIEVLVNVRVEIVPPSSITYGLYTKADKAARVVEWAEELKQFLSEHKGWDCADVNVIRDIEEQCAQCHSAWETYMERGNLCCASCGREVES